MSLIDNIFGSLPGPLIDQWGNSNTAFYIKRAPRQGYDPKSGTYGNDVNFATGSRTVSQERVEIKVLMPTIKPEEIRGEVQSTDLKFIFSAHHMPGYRPVVGDAIEFTQGSATRIARIFQPKTVSGDSPIMHTVFGRLT